MQINYIVWIFSIFSFQITWVPNYYFQTISERKENIQIYGGINNYFWTCLFYWQIYLIQEYLFKIFLSVQIHNTIS